MLLVQHTLCCGNLPISGHVIISLTAIYCMYVLLAFGVIHSIANKMTANHSTLRGHSCTWKENASQAWNGKLCQHFDRSALSFSRAKRPEHYCRKSVGVYHFKLVFENCVSYMFQLDENPPLQGNLHYQVEVGWPSSLCCKPCGFSISRQVL